MPSRTMGGSPAKAADAASRTAMTTAARERLSMRHRVSATQVGLQVHRHAVAAEVEVAVEGEGGAARLHSAQDAGADAEVVELRRDGERQRAAGGELRRRGRGV